MRNLLLLMLSLLLSFNVNAQEIEETKEEIEGELDIETK